MAFEIKTIGLYDLILQDVQKIAGKSKVSEDEILEIMEKNPQILRDYKQINVEYNIGNIHIKDIEIDTLSDVCQVRAKKVNQNLKKLRALEKYTLDFEQSSTLVIIFSIEFFVLFSVQYFIVLLDLKAWQWWIYSLFASSVLIAWLYGTRESKKFKDNNIIFLKLYDETLRMIASLEKEGCIKKEALIIAECEDHV